MSYKKIKPHTVEDYVCENMDCNSTSGSKLILTCGKSPLREWEEYDSKNYPIDIGRQGLKVDNYDYYLIKHRLSRWQSLISWSVFIENHLVRILTNTLREKMPEPISNVNKKMFVVLYSDQIASAPTFRIRYGYPINVYYIVKNGWFEAIVPFPKYKTELLDELSIPEYES